MKTPIKKYLVWCNIERRVLKEFLVVFDTNYQNIIVKSNNISMVAIDDIIIEYEWNETLKEHSELIDKYKKVGRDADFTELDIYKREHDNAPEGMKNSFTQRRIDEFLSLYDSIKSNGYIKEDKRLVKLIYIGGLTRKKECEWKSRTSENYYRLNGARRIIICKLLGIKEIPASIINIKIRTL